MILHSTPGKARPTVFTRLSMLSEVVVIVSEENGTISVAIGGLLKRHLMPEPLEKLLINELVPQEPTEQDDKLHMKLLKLLSAGKGDKDDEK